jgi:hypothetical protein
LTVPAISHPWCLFRTSKQNLLGFEPALQNNAITFGFSKAPVFHSCSGSCPAFQYSLVGISIFARSYGERVAGTSKAEGNFVPIEYSGSQQLCVSYARSLLARKTIRKLVSFTYEICLRGCAIGSGGGDTHISFLFPQYSALGRRAALGI